VGNETKNKNGGCLMLKWYDGEKVTPNKYAKLLILDKIDELLDGYWEEGLTNYDGTLDCTEKELEEVRRLLRKRAKGVYNYLGYTKEGL
jgi:hypothetical protein